MVYAHRFFLLSGPFVREADEGVAAHVFQLLMAGQIPIIAFFAFKWLSAIPASGVHRASRFSYSPA